MVSSLLTHWIILDVGSTWEMRYHYYNERRYMILSSFIPRMIPAHRGWDKMTAILQKFSKLVFSNENCHNLIKISLKFVCKIAIRTIITLVRHKKPGSIAKCMVRHKNVEFDTKMPSSTQKCPPQHASVDIAIIKDPPVLNICFQFYSNILF